jgi:murein DD-endopeptidase MepM/ murein hydrolase activator NlpD
MGGNISDDDSVQPIEPNASETQLMQPVVARPTEISNLYVQNLRTDIQKLRQKYGNQSTLIGQAMPGRNEPDMPTTAVSPSQKLLSQIRPESPAVLRNSTSQSAKSLQPNVQQLHSTPVNAAGASARDRLATIPVGTGATPLSSFQKRNIFPALPPLGAADAYLPKHTSVSYKGYIWPAQGSLTSGYGWRWGRMHRGIDIAGPVGTPIYAAAAGVVVKAGWNSGGYGNLVDIQHVDGSLTRYAHNKRILVQAGQVVQQGDQISEMGNTGFSTGPHLHFELRPRGQKAVNPMAFLPR